ncbi:MAG: leucine-rich repeat protein, partial [Lachnospiraceae bacterium]
MKKRSLNKIKQIVSIGMSCIMAGSTCNLPMMLHAEEVQTENMQPTYMVTSFDELNEEIAYQALSIGAEESEINFPDTLKVKVIRQVEGEPSTEADEEEASTEAVEEEPSTEVEEETTSKVLESQTEAESQTEEESEVESGTETEVKPQTEVESQTEIESESQTEVELQTEVENETLESESETEVPMTETEVPETTAASEPQTQVPETTVSESETESTEQLESDTTEEESSIVASLIDSIKGLFAPVEVYAAEEHLTYGACEGNGAEDSQEGEEWTIEHITWKLDAEKSSLPEFDSSEESAGAVYIYTPTIPETDENGNHYILSEEAILPEIYVMVDCVDNGIVLCSSNIVASGTCGAEGNNGDNLTWILDDEGLLTISGTGAMANWNRKGSPWYANKDKIESVMIEDGVTSIGKYAFFDCSSLASIKLPNSISSIGIAAFNNCSSLASITLPNSISSIGELAFYYCSSLTSITIPNSVTNIEKYAFCGCSMLASITISNSVTSIADSAFESCTRLKSITIPNNVISIGKNTFYDCFGLTSVIYLGNTEQWNNIRKNIGNGNDALLNNVKFHEHLPGTAWSNNDTYHWRPCADEACPVKDEPQAQDRCALHEWENGICRVCQYSCKHTGGTATCTKKAVCTECGIEYGEKDSNKHENLYHAAQAPTCTKNGYEAYWKCKNCAKLFSDEAGTHEINNPVEINANGHKLEKVEKKAPTCTGIGYEAYWKCSKCAKLFS